MDPDDAPVGWAAIPPVPTRTMSERINYPSFASILVCTLLIIVPFVGLVAFFVDIVMILRYVFGYRAPGSPQWSVHHPSITSLVVVWITAVCTVVVYPLAFYMTWRFFAEWQARRVAASKVCPRCAETIKAAALVCHHCGQEFDPLVALPVEATQVEAQPGPVGGGWTTAEAQGRSSKSGLYVLAAAAVVAVAVLATLSLIFLGGQVQTIPTSGSLKNISSSGSLPPCVLVVDGPLGHMEMYLRGASVSVCQAELASAREGFGPDSAGSRLYQSSVIPPGTPACTAGIIEVYASGANASAATQICDALTP